MHKRWTTFAAWWANIHSTAWNKDWTKKHFIAWKSPSMSPCAGTKDLHRFHWTMSLCWSRQVCCDWWLMHVAYQQKTVQDTGTSSARNTFFDNIHSGPQKIIHCQIIKNTWYISLKSTNEIRFLCQIEISIEHYVILSVRDPQSSNMRQI